MTSTSAKSCQMTGLAKVRCCASADGPKANGADTAAAVPAARPAPVRSTRRRLTGWSEAVMSISLRVS